MMKNTTIVTKDKLNWYTTPKLTLDQKINAKAKVQELTEYFGYHLAYLNSNLKIKSAACPLSLDTDAYLDYANYLLGTYKNKDCIQLQHRNKNYIRQYYLDSKARVYKIDLVFDIPIAT